MENIYSEVEPGRLLHILFRDSELSYKEGRNDLVPETEGLQVAALHLKTDQTFRAHRHIDRPREIPRTQECWVVIRGIVQVIYYDLDGELLCKRVLGAGDITITLAGGHNYRCFSATTRVAEIKTGPFVGVEADKEFIDA